MGFVHGTGPVPAPPSPLKPSALSWPSPAIDAVHFPLSPLPNPYFTPARAPPPYDPWAASAVWTPSPSNSFTAHSQDLFPRFSAPQLQIAQLHTSPSTQQSAQTIHHPPLHSHLHSHHQQQQSPQANLNSKSHRRKRRNPSPKSPNAPTSNVSTSARLLAPHFQNSHDPVIVPSASTPDVDPNIHNRSYSPSNRDSHGEGADPIKKVSPPINGNRASQSSGKNSNSALNASTSGRGSHSNPQNGRSQGQNSHLSVREYNRRISAYARRRDLNGALRTLAELDRAPKVSRNLFTYNAVINALVMCSQYAKADEFWREMQDSGIDPNLVTFNTMLKSCFGGLDEDVRRAFGLLQEMEDRGINADRVTLNSLINACVSAGRVRDAQDVYDQMRSLNIEPDAYTFCTLAKQARHQCDVSMLDALLLHQLHHHNVLQERVQSSPSLANEDPDSALQISPVAYNTIADAYIRCGHPERAISLLERMRDITHVDFHNSSTSQSSDIIPVRPDVQTFNVRLKALRESGAPASDAFAALEQMQTVGLEADHITLLTLADLCCRREEMALAEGVLHAATDADIKEFEKGSAEWKALCVNRASSRQSRDNSRINDSNQTLSSGKGTLPGSGGISQSQSHNNRRNANQPRNAKANAALFNALIRGYSSLDPPNVDAAVALYLEMRRYVETYGFSWYAADSVTYTMLVDGFARVCDAGRAELIVSEMEAAGRANVVAYNAYLKANRGKGFTAALMILERMKSAGLRPDVVTYNTVIDFLSSEENGTQIAEDLVRIDMPRNGVRPDLLTFNTLIKGVARNRGHKSDAGTALGAAYRWLRELQSRGLEPDEFTYQSMVSACAAAGDAPRALEFFRKVETERAKRVKANRKAGTSSQPSTSQRGAHSLRSASPLQCSSPSSSGSARFENGVPGSNSTSNGGAVVHTNQTAASSDWMLLPHPAAYVALMRAFLSSGAKDGVESVLLLRDEMVARGLELGRTGYTAVADAYAERADFESVDATLREMISKESPGPNQKLSPVHHCIRMKSLCNGGKLDEAIAILPEVENADTAVFNVLIFACAKNKDMDRMIKVLRSMEASNIEPDAITSRALSGLMRNIARTLRTFDERFYASITKLASPNAAQGGSGEDEDSIDKTLSSVWGTTGKNGLPIFGATQTDDG